MHPTSPFILEQKSSASPTSVYHPRSLLKYSMTGLTPICPDSVGLGWNSEMCIKCNASSGRCWCCRCMDHTCPVPESISNPPLCRVPLDNSGRCSLWDASAAVPKTGWLQREQLQPPHRHCTRGNPPGPARFPAVADQRGGAGPGAQGRGLAPGGGAWRAGSCCLLLATEEAGAEGTASGRRAADSQAGSPPKGKGRRARWQVSLPGSCCPSPRVSPGALSCVWALGVFA